MTSNYDDFNLNQIFDQIEQNSSIIEPSISNLGDNDIDNAEIDRFELLSAYLDGEVSVEERQQVQYWLDNDPQIKKIYLQLSRLHNGIGNIPMPQETISPKELSERVLQNIDSTKRKRQISLWGGGAIAALVLATISNLFIGGGNAPTLRLAESSEQEGVPAKVMVAVAVNKPAVIIPKTAISSTEEELLENSSN